MAITHPWISFSINLSEVATKTWISLGECVSKIQHIVGTPLMPAIAEEMRRAFVSKGIHGTAAIEGNTLELEDVEQRLQDGLSLPASQEYLGREIDNLNRGYSFLSEVLLNEGEHQVVEARIREYNRLILDGLESEEGVQPGVYAQKQHGVAGYRAPTPVEIRELMPAFAAWLNDKQAWDVPEGIPDLAITILKAITAHLYVAWIHPFGDGNGRTARLLEAEILASGGVPDVSFHLLSDHYNRTRAVYYRRLEATSQDPHGRRELFIEYAIQGLVERLRQQINQVKKQHRDVVWRDYVHDHFRGQDSVRYQRLRRLAMDLALQKDVIPKGSLWTISDRVIKSYRGKTSKTVTRDINELSKRGLIRRVAGGYLANLEVLDAFVPAKRKVDVKGRGLGEDSN